MRRLWRFGCHRFCVDLLVYRRCLAFSAGFMQSGFSSLRPRLFCGPLQRHAGRAFLLGHSSLPACFVFDSETYRICPRLLVFFCGYRCLSSYPILSYPILSPPVLSCPALSCSILFYLILFCSILLMLSCPTRPSSALPWPAATSRSPCTRRTSSQTTLSGISWARRPSDRGTTRCVHVDEPARLCPPSPPPPPLCGFFVAPPRKSTHFLGDGESTALWMQGTVGGLFVCWSLGSKWRLGRVGLVDRCRSQPACVYALSFFVLVYAAVVSRCAKRCGERLNPYCT